MARPALVLWSWLALAIPALAQPPANEAREMPARIVLAAPDCGLELHRTVELLRVELQGDGVDEVILATDRVVPRETDPPLAVVSVSPIPCQAAATELEVTIDDLVTRKQVKRVLVAEATAEEARPRALALGIAELLRASWAELSMADSTEPSPFRQWIRRRVGFPEGRDESAASELSEPAERRLEARPADAAPAPPDPLRLDAAFAVRSFPSGGASLLGGAAGISVPFSALPVALRISAIATVGRSDVGAGSVDLRQVSVRAGIDVATPSGSLSVAVGPLVEAGIGWASGQAREDAVAHSGSTAIVLAGAHLAIRAKLFGPVEAVLDLAGGYAARGFEATVDGDPVTGLVGPHLDALIGLALVPSRWGEP